MRGGLGEGGVRGWGEPGARVLAGARQGLARPLTAGATPAPAAAEGRADPAPPGAPPDPAGSGGEGAVLGPRQRRGAGGSPAPGAAAAGRLRVPHGPAGDSSRRRARPRGYKYLIHRRSN